MGLCRFLGFLLFVFRYKKMIQIGFLGKNVVGSSFWPPEMVNDRTRDNVLYASTNDTSLTKEKLDGCTTHPSKKNKKMGRRVSA